MTSQVRDRVSVDCMSCLDAGLKRVTCLQTALGLVCRVYIVYYVCMNAFLFISLRPKGASRTRVVVVVT